MSSFILIAGVLSAALHRPAAEDGRVAAFNYVLGTQT